MSRRLDKDLVQKLLLEGKSPGEVVNLLGFSKKTVYRVIKDNNLKFKTKSALVKETAQKIAAEFSNTNKSLRELAKEFNLSPTRVTQVLKELNIPVPTERKNSARERTCIKKFGVTNVMFNQDIISKREKHFQDKFGYKNPSQSKEVLEKAKQTLIKKYGVDNPLKNPEVKSKVALTNLQRYGGNAPACSVNVVQKMQKTYKTKTGYDNPAHNPEVVKKKISTNLTKYGVTHPMKSSAVVEKIQALRLQSGFIKTFLVEGKEFTTPELVRKYGYSTSAVLAAGKALNPQDFLTWLNREHDRASSRGEKELLDFVKQSVPHFKVQSRRTFNKQELDVFIPDLNLGIEYNGDFYHSILMKRKSYHKTKKDHFEGLGIDTVFIYECDWNTKKDLIKTFLKNKLGIFTKFNARDCIVKELTTKDYREFLEANHLQGYAYSQIKLGLYLKEELVSVSSFSKPRYSSKAQWELVRFCNKADTRVIGSFAKMFSHFKKIYTPSSIISYSDRDLFNGSLYKNNGFKFIEHTGPSYFYVKAGVKHNRVKFQRHKLPNLLSEFNSALSELENMINHGFLPIFTAGNSVFLWEDGTSSQNRTEVTGFGVR